MPDKKQYDDELVQLLARGELADSEIAKRLGLSPSQVSRIAGGEKRPELQPKILAAMRKTLKAAWKNGGHLDPSTKLRASKLGTGRLDTESPSINSGSKTGTADGEASPATPVAGKTAQTAFDRHLAVELIASGELTLSQIADRLGVHKTTVSRIVAGRSHPELQRLIREAEKGYRDRARRIGVKWSAQIVMKQIQVGLKNNGWVGLRARQDLLDRFLGPEEERDRYAEPEEPPFITAMNKLPEALRDQVIEALGGPAADSRDEYVYWNDPSTWKPVGAAAEAAAAEAAAAQEDAAKEQAAKEAAAALQKNDAAQPSAAEQEQKNDVSQPPSAESACGGSEFTRRGGTSTAAAGGDCSTEEGCSRNKKRRRRRQVDSFLPG